MPHHPMPPGAHGSPDAELAAILPAITGPSGQFRHRQHINLACSASTTGRRPWLPGLPGTAGSSRTCGHFRAGEVGRGQLGYRGPGGRRLGSGWLLRPCGRQTVRTSRTAPHGPATQTGQG